MTTDGIRRKHAPLTKVTTDAPTTTTIEKTAGAATATAALDALDELKGTSTGARGGQGVKGALAGLAAVEKKHKWNWRAAVAGALLGLSLISGIQQPSHLSDTMRQQTSTLVEQAPVRNFVAARILATSEPVVDSSAMAPVVTAPVVTAPVVTAPVVTAPVVVDGQGGMPITLATLFSGTAVKQGRDLGDFYCEHAYFTMTAEAMKADSSVLKNSSGEVLTGFLHNPTDGFTYARSGDLGDDAAKVKVQSERHSERADVVGAAIRGYFEDAQGQIGDAPFRLLLTGYMQWGDVIDNPTGDFVGHRENVDAAMKRAFGSDLIEGKLTQSVASGLSHDRLEYQVRGAGGVRSIVIDAAQLPVSDDAINGSAASIQSLMTTVKPHAVLSMGVLPGSTWFQAEVHADDGGLRTDGPIRHDGSKGPTESKPDNFALSRAIYRAHLQMRPLVATIGGD